MLLGRTNIQFPHVTIERWWYEKVPTWNCQGGITIQNNKTLMELKILQCWLLMQSHAFHGTSTINKGNHVYHIYSISSMNWWRGCQYLVHIWWSVNCCKSVLQKQIFRFPKVFSLKKQTCISCILSPHHAENLSCYSQVITPRNDMSIHCWCRKWHRGEPLKQNSWKDAITWYLMLLSQSLNWSTWDLPNRTNCKFSYYLPAPGKSGSRRLWIAAAASKLPSR